MSEHPNRPSLVDELMDRISHVLPQATALRGEAKTQLHAALQQVFAKMDLLTREEFAAQQRALERAEQKIAELELIVTALEARQIDQQVDAKNPQGSQVMNKSKKTPDDPATTLP